MNSKSSRPMTKGSLNSKVEFFLALQGLREEGRTADGAVGPSDFVQRRKLDQVMVSGKAVRVALPLTGF